MSPWSSLFWHQSFVGEGCAARHVIFDPSNHWKIHTIRSQFDDFFHCILYELFWYLDSCFAPPSPWLQQHHRHSWNFITLFNLSKFLQGNLQKKIALLYPRQPLATTLCIDFHACTQTLERVTVKSTFCLFIYGGILSTEIMIQMMSTTDSNPPESWQK